MKKIVFLIIAIVALTAQTSSATFYVPLKGTIKGVYVMYNDADEITIKSGYGECSGNS